MRKEKCWNLFISPALPIALAARHEDENFLLQSSVAEDEKVIANSVYVPQLASSVASVRCADSFTGQYSRIGGGGVQ